MPIRDREPVQDGVGVFPTRYAPLAGLILAVGTFVYQAGQLTSQIGEVRTHQLAQDIRIKAVEDMASESRIDRAMLRGDLKRVGDDVTYLVTRERAKESAK